MATAALFLWPIIPPILFVAFGPARGLIWSVLIGYLFLPEAIGFNVPGLPPYNKGSALAISLVLPAAIFWRRARYAPKGGSTTATALMGLCLAAYFASAIGTYLTNRAPVIVAESVRQGLRFNDVVSMTSEAVFLLIPVLVVGLEGLVEPIGL